MNLNLELNQVETKIQRLEKDVLDSGYLTNKLLNWKIFHIEIISLSMEFRKINIKLGTYMKKKYAILLKKS